MHVHLWPGIAPDEPVAAKLLTQLKFHRNFSIRKASLCTQRLLRESQRGLFFCCSIPRLGDVQPHRKEYNNLHKSHKQSPRAVPLPGLSAAFTKEGFP